MMSRSSPSILAASAAFASPGPMSAAICAGVVPRTTSRAEPSGRVTRIIWDIEKSAFLAVGLAPGNGTKTAPLCQYAIGAARGGFTIGVAMIHYIIRSEEHTSELQSLMRIPYAAL